MKQLLAVFILLSYTLFANDAIPQEGGQITEDRSFQTVYADPQNSDKLILMIYTAKSCPQCAYMKQKVFTDEKVKAFMTKHFVVLEKDINTDDLPKGFEYFGIPTMFFVNKNGKEVEKFIGSSRAEPFLETLQTIARERL